MKSDYADETFEKVVNRVFEAHQSISYISIMDDQLNMKAYKGFVDMHPAKLKKLRIQAILLVKMCSIWSEPFGSLEYSCASFSSRQDIMVVPLSNRLNMVVIISQTDEVTLRAIRKAIFDELKAVS